MKRTILSIYVVISLFAGVSGIFGVGEKTVGFGAVHGWRDIDIRQGLVEVANIRPNPVLALSSSVNFPLDVPLDLYLSFDEGSPARFRDQGGHYSLAVFAGLEAVGAQLARQGGGAARFSSAEFERLVGSREGGPLVLRPGRGAMFAPGAYIRDFTMEFWLCPANLENGEQILGWSSTLAAGSAGYISQRIQAEVSRNRIQWTFTNFFVDPQGRLPSSSRSVTLTGSPILPRTWSHHLIRFNSTYGFLEYLVDGRLEALTYVTSTGREGGDVYTPVIGQDSTFVLGGRYTGLMDEFRIYPQYSEKSALTKYPSEGGRIQSRTMDLGGVNTRLLKLEAKGGRIIGGTGRSEYAGSGGFRFGDHAELRFYIRFSNNPYQWEMPWIHVESGVDFPDTYRGRYAQVAVEFFPSGDGETTPYLEEVNLVYRSIEPPPPPSQLVAMARDGAVELSWRAVADSSLGGYLVYFGTSREDYFGVQGSFSSPLDVGNRTSVRIDGLRNGTLYYFTVASYDKEFHEPGEFSREVAARPQRDFLSP